MFSHFNSIAFAWMLLPITAFASVEPDTQCLSEFQQAWDKDRVWYLMDESCPIGKGVWSQEPTEDAGIFWVQCGMLTQLPKAWFAALLKESVSDDEIVLKMEDSNFRCLLGPFYSYNKAKKVKDELRVHSQLKTAFIRDVSFIGKPVKMAKEKKQKTEMLLTPPVISKPMVTEAVVINDVPISHSTENVVTNIIEEEYDALPEDMKLKRDYFEVAGLRSPKPQLNELHYFSDDRLWLRATLNQANSACENDGMKLVSAKKLRALATVDKTRKQLPNRLPFWVQEQHAFDLSMMIPMDLTAKSALYVLCE